MDPLLTFYRNESERNAVKAFFVDALGAMAINNAFAGESTIGIKEAKECVQNAFDKLEELYTEKQEPIISNSR